MNFARALSYLKISFHKIIIEIYFHHFLLFKLNPSGVIEQEKSRFQCQKILIRAMIYYQSISSSCPLHMTNFPKNLLHSLIHKKKSVILDSFIEIDDFLVRYRKEFNINQLHNRWRWGSRWCTVEYGWQSGTVNLVCRIDVQGVFYCLSCILFSFYITTKKSKNNHFCKLG